MMTASRPWPTPATPECAIRIGVNGGSLEKHILAKYGAPVPEAMVESAMYHVRCCKIRL